MGHTTGKLFSALLVRYNGSMRSNDREQVGRRGNPIEPQSVQGLDVSGNVRVSCAVPSPAEAEL